MFNKKKSTRDLVHSDENYHAEEPQSSSKAKKEKKPKDKKARRPVKEVIKSRGFIGTLCIVFGLLIAFVATPLVEAQVTKSVPTVVLSQDAPVGTRLTAEYLTIKEFAQNSRPAGAMLSPEDALGQFVTVAGVAGDIVTPARLSENYPTDDPALLHLPEGKMAMATSLAGQEQSVASKLRAGDVIQIFAVLQQSGVQAGLAEAISLPQLQSVEVIAVTNSEAVDVKDGEVIENQDRQVTTVILAVDRVQAAALAGAGQSAKLHAALVSRGDPDRKQALLEAQTAYLTTPTEDIAPEEAPTTEVPPATEPTQNMDAGLQEGGDAS